LSRRRWESTEEDQVQTTHAHSTPSVGIVHLTNRRNSDIIFNAFVFFLIGACALAAAARTSATEAGSVGVQCAA
jgi:hypothetical protein